ncbi:hypothetical protein DACRYDRAFT_114014 [Dacryopinax primogenitus]|uniref:Epidermal growth factor receptor-like transmembrane-juxtamembrane segment domain-containing protein n=1 Tax=Dacryopinax primogenitus (strain DJM 731) TaxID=1858805 RepID=M5GG04_DACPD|nr:uncharacterized protein DACRYDRAFT_114014 [Dacryopinax primogenitus]EJU04643.1 hypothetical protein DACRYDRAFT_114014 [Dacryopinax primogenitus]
MACLIPVLRALLILTGLVYRASAVGVTNATCTQNLWTANLEGQSPCLVWAQLQSLCLNSTVVYVLINVPPGEQYEPPFLTDQINPCTCNVVSYNLMAACSWCQTGITLDSWVPEDTWKNGCQDYDATGLPSSVSLGAIEIPSWAYVPANGTYWNPTIAEALVSGSASSSQPGLISSPTNTPSGGTTTSSTVSQTGTSSTSTSSGTPVGGLVTSSGGSQSSDTPSHTTNTSNLTGAAPSGGNTASPSTQPTSPTPVGVIVGGVVGGVAILALLGLLLFFLLRRRRSQSELRTTLDISEMDPPAPVPFMIGGGPMLGGRLSTQNAGTPFKMASAPPPRNPRLAYTPTPLMPWEGTPVSTNSGNGYGSRGELTTPDALGILRSSPPQPPDEATPVPWSSPLISSPSSGSRAGSATGSGATSTSPPRSEYPLLPSEAGVNPNRYSYDTSGEVLRSPTLPTYEQARAAERRARMERRRAERERGQGKRPWHAGLPSTS